MLVVSGGHAMSSWRQQALIEASVQDVWDVVGDPNRYPEWAGNVVEVTGLPADAGAGAAYEQVTRRPMHMGQAKTTFVIDALEELKEIRLQCQATGYYSRWLLTEAEGSTFAEVEIGMEPIHMSDRAVDRTIGKRWYRGLVADAIDGLKQAVRPLGPAAGD
jgi:uncharacterized protein YndB with AHSA1/START domain